MMGEIFIGGTGVAKGYYKNPDLTNQRFLDDPFLVGGKMYRTGDLGQLTHDGELLCIGRKDSQVKVRGFRIELGEIEAVIMSSPEIKEAVVMVREDQPGDKRLVAYISAASGSVGKESLVVNCRALCRKLLPSYMLPELVYVEKMPVTPNGKIDKNLLLKPSEYKEPQSIETDNILTPIESIVLEIWKDKLGLPHIGLYDDFFEIGGHSLIAIEIVGEIYRRTSVRLPLSALFEYSTVKTLSALITGPKPDTDQYRRCLVPIRPAGSKCPLYIIHGGGSHVMKLKAIASYMDNDQPVFALQAIGANGFDEPVTKMESIAARYIAEMIEQNPHGPFAVCGYSFGGIIAFEIAKQLKAMGKTVTMLGLFDSYADQSDYHKPLIVRLWNSTSYNILNACYKLIVSIRDPRYVVGYFMKYKFPALQKKWGSLFSATGEVPVEEREVFAVLDKIMYANKLAQRDYVLTPYDGIVDLFRSRKKLYYAEDYNYLGWKPFALGGINVHDIPGNHLDIFDAPNDREFARTLQKVVNQNCARMLSQTENLSAPQSIEVGIPRD